MIIANVKKGATKEAAMDTIVLYDESAKPFKIPNQTFARAYSVEVRHTMSSLRLVCLACVVLHLLSFSGVVEFHPSDVWMFMVHAIRV